MLLDRNALLQVRNSEVFGRNQDWILTTWVDSLDYPTVRTGSGSCFQYTPGNRLIQHPSSHPTVTVVTRGPRAMIHDCRVPAVKNGQFRTHEIFDLFSSEHSTGSPATSRRRNRGPEELLKFRAVIRGRYEFLKHFVRRPIAGHFRQAEPRCLLDYLRRCAFGVYEFVNILHYRQSPSTVMFQARRNGVGFCLAAGAMNDLADGQFTLNGQFEGSAQHW